MVNMKEKTFIGNGGSQPTNFGNKNQQDFGGIIHSITAGDIPSFAGHHLVGRFNPCGIFGFWGSHVSRRRKGASDTSPFWLPRGIPSTRNVQVQWETDEQPGESGIGRFELCRPKGINMKPVFWEDLGFEPVQIDHLHCQT